MLDIEKTKAAALVSNGEPMLIPANEVLEPITRLEAAEKDAERYLYICEMDHKDRNWIDSFDDYKKRRDSRIDEAIKESEK